MNPYIYTLKIKNQNLVPSDAKFDGFYFFGIIFCDNDHNVTFVTLDNE